MAQSNKPNLKSNVLHGFETYNTLFTLSGISEKEIQTHTFLTDPVHEVIARTGGIGSSNVRSRKFDDPEQGSASVYEQEIEKTNYKKNYGDSINILARAHDLFIENVNMISTVGPNNERSLGNFTKMEFEVVEPFGITFIEKVRAATAINKFLDYQDAPLLLTIEFKGNTGGDGGFEPGLVDRVTGKFSGNLIVRKIPILLTRVDFDVTEAGAKYSVVAVPYTDLAYDDRFKYPRTVLTSQADTIDEWIQDTMDQLRVQQKTEKEIDKTRTFEDIYEIRYHPDVAKRGRKYDTSLQSTNQAGAPKDQEIYYDDFTTAPEARAKKKGSEAQGNPNIAITKYFEDAIRSLTGYQELANDFWVAYLKGTGAVEPGTLKNLTKDQDKFGKFLQGDKFRQIVAKNQYVDWFKIKTTVNTNNPQNIDPITKMASKTIIYYAFPYRIHILKFMPPGVSLGNIDWSKRVAKEYDFIYTGDNVDVQNLRINYKTAYYLRNVRGDDQSGTEKGWLSEFFQGFKEIFGQERDPEPLLPLRQYPSAIMGGNTVSTNSGTEKKAQQFYDYLTHPEVDMMKIELDILGDPDYLCQDMYLPIRRDRKDYGLDSPIDPSTGSFAADRYQPIINVRYRLPTDIDDKKGTMFSEGLDGKALFRDENLFFNGLYQVNKIESKFDQGQFLQTLYCSRFNNQQGSGAPPVLVSSATKSLTKLKDKNNENLNNTFVADKIKEQIKQKATNKYINNEVLYDADGNVDGL